MATHEHIFTHGLRTSMAIFAGIWGVGVTFAMLDGGSEAQAPNSKPSVTRPVGETNYDLTVSTPQRPVEHSSGDASNGMTGAFLLSSVALVSEYMAARRRRVLYDADGHYIDGKHDEISYFGEESAKLFNEIIEDF